LDFPGKRANIIDQTLDVPWNRLTRDLQRATPLLAVVLLVFIATRLWLLMAFEARGRDSEYYALIARQGVDLQQVAFRDVEVEYPPVAWWLIAMPRLVDSKTYAEPAPTPERVRQFFDWYFNWFHAEMCFADVVCLGLTFLIGRRISSTAQWGLPAAYTLLVIAQPHLAYDRLDIGLLMFFLLFIECWLSSDFGGLSRAASLVEPRPLENSSAVDRSAVANRWATASYLFLGLGISFKIMPVIFVPFLLLADWWAAGSGWRFAGRFLALTVGVAGPFLVHLLSAGWGVFALFQYHGQRGIHLESIWGSLMLALRPFGLACHVVKEYGGFNMESDWSAGLKIVSSAALLTMAASFGLWALLRGRRFDQRLALDTAMLVLINSTVLAHVFSPQYLNWLLPLATLLALNIFPRSRALWCGFAALSLAIVGISSWIFPSHCVGKLTVLETGPVVLSVARSACLAGLALLLNVCFFAKYGLNPWRVGKEAPSAPAAAT